MNVFTQKLIENTDEEYRVFSKKLIPDTRYEILGVRVPVIKRVAGKCRNGEVSGSDVFSKNHSYYEEWFLHGILIEEVCKDINGVFSLLDGFLPRLDNWAVCDSTSASLKIIKKNRSAVLDKIAEWKNSDNPYTVRFAITVLMNYYISETTEDGIFEIVNGIDSDNYYVNTAAAWFYSVALVKCYEKAILFLQNGSLKTVIHNKAIQKAIESFRIADNVKKYLKTLRRKN